MQFMINIGDESTTRIPIRIPTYLWNLSWIGTNQAVNIGLWGQEGSVMWKHTIVNGSRGTSGLVPMPLAVSMSRRAAAFVTEGRGNGEWKAGKTTVHFKQARS